MTGFPLSNAQESTWRSPGKWNEKDISSLAGSKITSDPGKANERSPWKYHTFLNFPASAIRGFTGFVNTIQSPLPNKLPKWQGIPGLPYVIQQ